MARVYHSPSSDAQGRRCKRLWWYTYGEGLRDAEVPWVAIANYKADKKKDARGVMWWRDPTGKGEPITSKQRGASLGKCAHDVLQKWYETGRIPPAQGAYALPVRVAMSGLHHLPHPSKCHDGAVERPIGKEVIVEALFPSWPEGKPRVGLRVDGIMWAGFRDLVVCAPAEFIRLGINAPDGWALYDHKSTRNIVQYALRGDVDAFAATRKVWPGEDPPGLLRDDFQCNLYAFATMTELGIAELPACWVYYETQDKRQAAPVLAHITLADARAHVEAASVRAHELDRITCLADAEQNPHACKLYGGCEHHVSAGGSCDARRPIGSLIQLRVKGKKPMAVPDRFKKSFDKNKAAQGGEALAEGAAASAEAPAEKRKRGRPRAVAAATDTPEQAANAGEAASAETDGRILWPGKHGAIVIQGHTADLLELTQMLLGMPE